MINYFIDTKVHAEITFDGDEDLFFVTDLGSRNGTFLNDNILSEVCTWQLYQLMCI